MNYDHLLGLLAGFLTTVAFVPQAWRVWKTRSVKDISLGMYIIFTTGVGLWLVYGIIINSLPLILVNYLWDGWDAGTETVFQLG